MIRTRIAALLVVPLAACAPILSRVPFFGRRAAGASGAARAGGGGAGDFVGDGCWSDPLRPPMIRRVTSAGAGAPGPEWRRTAR